MSGAYKTSPQGIARHAWINKPDTKFVTTGLYHTGLIIDGDEAAKFMAEIKAAAEQAFAEELEKKKVAAKAQKEWSVYYPYEVEKDEENDNPTGRVMFTFKQNALIRQADGAMKKFILGIRDSQDKPTTANVFSGSVIRVRYKPRAVLISGPKQAGVRLDFSMVQLITPASGGGGGFGAVDGGFVDNSAPSEGTASEDAEY